MRVFSTIRGTVRDGRLEEAITSAAEGARLVARHGGDVRLLLGVAGEEADTTLFSIEYDGLEAMGRAFDKMGADPDVMAYTARTKAPDAPSALGMQSVGHELPTGHTPTPGRGTIIEVHTSTVMPGRMEQVLVESAEVCAFVEAHGAVNARLLQLGYAGAGSGMTGLVWEHASWASHAAVSEAWWSPTGLELQARFSGPDPASMTVASALYNDIPL